MIAILEYLDLSIYVLYHMRILYRTRMVCTIRVRYDFPYHTRTVSRHTIVCRAAQEAGAPHREYIDRKKENVIFTLLYLGDGLSD